jgi:hypothetical protein
LNPEVNWASFRTALGVATDVPGLLAALNDESVQIRRSAGWDLAERVHNQGCLSSASIPTTRCLLPVALAREAPGHEDALVVLIYIAAAAVPDESGLTSELSTGVLNGLADFKQQLLSAVVAEAKPAHAAGLLFLLACIADRLSTDELMMVDGARSIWANVAVATRLAHIVLAGSLAEEVVDDVRDEVLEALDASE